MNMLHTPEGVGGVVEGGVGLGGLVLCNHTLGYGDEGPKAYTWIRKMGQNQTFDNRKCHQINHL